MTVRHAALADAAALRDAWNRIQPAVAAWWGPNIAGLYDANISLAALKRFVRGYVAEDAIGPLGFFLIHRDERGEHLELHLIGPTNWVQTTRGLTKAKANALRRQTSLDLYTAWFTDLINEGTPNAIVWSEGPPTTPAETLTLAHTIGFTETLTPAGWFHWEETAASGLAKVQVA